ncbi:hypothetical protein PR048_019402 [Dryococelus australis]|uniref:Uncharacterized protein n=1 Tax=Dryococelus australis TaxID=614101 RepID=A0ABQ9H3E4_9NEOP|nr:hypothetical protein PR048_019402 [Dryococelus australis]
MLISTAHRLSAGTDEGDDRPVFSRSSAGIKWRGKREVPEKTSRPAASSGTIPTCENLVTRPGIEPEAAVVWWLDYSPPTPANRFRFPTGSLPDFRMWESCQTMTLLSAFSRGSPVPCALSFRRCSILRFPLIGSQDLDVKSHPNLFTHSLTNDQMRTVNRSTARKVLVTRTLAEGVILGPTAQRYGGNNYRLACRSDEALGVRVSVARVSLPRFLTLLGEGGGWGRDQPALKFGIWPVHAAKLGPALVERRMKWLLEAWTMITICWALWNLSPVSRTDGNRGPALAHAANSVRITSRTSGCSEEIDWALHVKFLKFLLGQLGMEHACLPPRRTGLNTRPGHWIFAVGRRVFSGISRLPRSIFTSITLLGPQDLAVKSHTNLFTHSPNLSFRDTSVQMFTRLRPQLTRASFVLEQAASKIRGCVKGRRGPSVARDRQAKSRRELIDRSRGCAGTTNSGEEERKERMFVVLQQQARWQGSKASASEEGLIVSYKPVVKYQADSILVGKNISICSEFDPAFDHIGGKMLVLFTHMEYCERDQTLESSRAQYHVYGRP